MDGIMTQMHATKEVLYLSYDGMTDPLGQSQVLPYLTGLSKLGYRFHLISFEKPERFAQHRDHIQQWCDQAGITWFPLTYTKRPPLISTMRDIRKMKKKAVQLHREHTFFLIHCRSYLPALVGLSMKRKFGTRFLFDMRGFWADERIDGRIWNIRNPLFKAVYGFFKRKEKDFLREADHTVSVTQAGKDEILAWQEFQKPPSEITVIPCCVNLDLFDPHAVSSEQKIQLRQSLGMDPNATVLGYVGSIGTWYMLDEMLDYFSALQSVQKNALF